MFLIGKRIAIGRNYINRFLGIIKWPVAVAMLFVVPAAFQTFQRYYVIRDQLNGHNLLYFGIGVGFFAVVRVFFIMKRGTAETMEHEMTHSLFAMLTLHPVQHLEVFGTGGGAMTFAGKGNWLIALSPYFFPSIITGVRKCTKTYSSPALFVMEKPFGSFQKALTDLIFTIVLFSDPLLTLLMPLYQSVEKMSIFLQKKSFTF